MVIETNRTRRDNNLDQLLEEIINTGSCRQADLEGIGERLGFYDAMLQFGPMTAADLSEFTGISEATTCAWLGAELVGESIVYDPYTGCYSLWASWPLIR